MSITPMERLREDGVGLLDGSGSFHPHALKCSPPLIPSQNQHPQTSPPVLPCCAPNRKRPPLQSRQSSVGHSPVVPPLLPYQVWELLSQRYPEPHPNPKHKVRDAEPTIGRPVSMTESEALTFLTGVLPFPSSGDELDWERGRLFEDARWSFFLAFLPA